MPAPPFSAQPVTFTIVGNHNVPSQRPEDIEERWGNRTTLICRGHTLAGDMIQQQPKTAVLPAPDSGHTTHRPLSCPRLIVDTQRTPPSSQHALQESGSNHSIT